ncbi:MAG: SIS domain-containing protein [Phycisphaeraceae bacterium]|nr:SIS domain-containing protein [Phycisphaeraceae bacterium]
MSLKHSQALAIGTGGLPGALPTGAIPAVIPGAGGLPGEANLGFLEDYRRNVLAALEAVDLKLVGKAIEWFRQTRRSRRQAFVCGNGGSAATASHFVCDMVKGASYQQWARFRIMALTDSMATITAYANDVGFEMAFVEQLKNFAVAGDLVMAISGSGRSANVVRALKYANGIGCRTIALTGKDGGELGPVAQLHLHVAEPHMGRIEDVHMSLCHMIAYAFMDDAAEAIPPTLPLSESGSYKLPTQPELPGA